MEKIKWLVVSRGLVVALLVVVLVVVEQWYPGVRDLVCRDASKPSGWFSGSTP